ncbi:hypothetical protein L195_g002358 [Trifolium pratense]|uniref:Uncharacterized protein n=1 Tax=Trifolium pratense TaxID=57577 RepID=A0A2K3NS83_TRIPR|nr:hypothetical protein L195_g002358 [Trifolium pratense]
MGGKEGGWKETDRETSVSEWESVCVKMVMKRKKGNNYFMGRGPSSPEFGASSGIK